MVAPNQSLSINSEVTPNGPGRSSRGGSSRPRKRVVTSFAGVTMLALYLIGTRRFNTIPTRDGPTWNPLESMMTTRAGYQCLPKEVFPSCNCMHPGEATHQLESPQWRHHHYNMVRQAQTAPDPLDFVMVGDSLVERWNGTRNLGTVALPRNRQVFDALFTKTGGGSLEGLALGSARDTTNDVLWHLHYGALADTLYPKVWMIVAGTNNLGLSGCNRENVVAGILHVVQYIHEMRPDAQILVHGLLPRIDPRYITPKNWSTDILFNEIQRINADLQHACKMHPSMHYMNADHVFLRFTKDGMHIDADRMKDGLHPTPAGYKSWGLAIAATLKQVLEETE